MRLAERLERMIDGMPLEASVTLHVSTLHEWLGASTVRFEPDLTVKEIAKLVGRKATTVRAWIRSERLAAYTFNGREYRVTHAALQEFTDKFRAG